MDGKVNLAEKVGLLDEPYSPGIVGYLNDVLRGHLTIQLRDRDIELDEGEMFVVPRGVRALPQRE